VLSSCSSSLRAKKTGGDGEKGEAGEAFYVTPSRRPSVKRRKKIRGGKKKEEKQVAHPSILPRGKKGKNVERKGEEGDVFVLPFRATSALAIPIKKEIRQKKKGKERGGERWENGESLCRINHALSAAEGKKRKKEGRKKKPRPCPPIRRRGGKKERGEKEGEREGETASIIIPSVWERKKKNGEGKGEKGRKSHFTCSYFPMFTWEEKKAEEGGKEEWTCDLLLSPCFRREKKEKKNSKRRRKGERLSLLTFSLFRRRKKKEKSKEKRKKAER